MRFLICVPLIIALSLGAFAQTMEEPPPRIIRSLPDSVLRGDTFAVSLTIEPFGEEMSFREKYPDGWEVVRADPIFHLERPDSSFPYSVGALVPPHSEPLVLNYVLRVPEESGSRGDFAGNTTEAVFAGASSIEIGTTINVWGFDLNTWELIGVFGTLFFSSRFIVQWIASERKGKSVVPRAFWFLSIGGSAILLLYGIHFRRFAVVLGQSFGFFVYIRNLRLIYRNSARKKRAAQSANEKA